MLATSLTGRLVAGAMCGDAKGSKNRSEAAIWTMYVPSTWRRDSTRARGKMLPIYLRTSSIGTVPEETER